MLASNLNKGFLFLQRQLFQSQDIEDLGFRAADSTDIVDFRVQVSDKFNDLAGAVLPR